MDVDDDVFGIDMERFGSLGTLHQRERERASERKANDMDKVVFLGNQSSHVQCLALPPPLNCASIPNERKERRMDRSSKKLLIGLV